MTSGTNGVQQSMFLAIINWLTQFLIPKRIREYFTRKDNAFLLEDPYYDEIRYYGNPNFISTTHHLATGNLMILEDDDCNKVYVNLDHLTSKTIKMVYRNESSVGYTVIQYVDGEEQNLYIDCGSHDDLVEEIHKRTQKCKESSPQSNE